MQDGCETRSTTFPWHNNKVSVFYPVYKFPWSTYRVAITHRASVVKIASCYGMLPFGRRGNSYDKHYGVSRQFLSSIKGIRFLKCLEIKGMAESDIYIFFSNSFSSFEDRFP